MENIQTYSPDQVTDAIAENQGLLFIHFGSPLASSCEVVRQELETVAPAFATRVRFAELELPLQDVDLIQKYSIETIPTLVLFKGDREVERLEHLMLEEELKELLEMACSYYHDPVSGSGKGDDHI